MSTNDNKLRCLIIDDDPMITDLIIHFCNKIEEISYCLACNDAIDGLKLLSSDEFDIVFLDYNMPNLDGKSILDLKKDSSKVIMITSHSEFAVESYNYENLVDFLLKPIKFDRFYKAIKKVVKLSHEKEEVKNQEYYFVKDGSKWVKIYYKDLLFIKSDSNYVIWQTTNRQVVSLMKLKDLENVLPPSFLRVHRSYIINSDKIDSLSKDALFISDKEIPVGKNYKDMIDSILNKRIH